MDFKRVQEVAEKMGKKTGGLIGLFTLPYLFRELNLTTDQIEQFCDTTPNGEELWIKFRTRRDTSRNENYDMKVFILEVLNPNPTADGEVAKDL